MPCNIYLDTSILCSLADPPARSAYARTCQTLTRRWFRALPHTRNLCTSTFALDKIKAGPVSLASARLHLAEKLHALSTEAIFTTKTELFLAGGGQRTLTYRILNRSIKRRWTPCMRNWSASTPGNQKECPR